MDGRKKTKAGGASGGAVDFSSLLSDLTAQFSSAHAARPAPKPARVDGAKPSSRANDDGAAPPAAALAGGDDINSLFSALDKPKKKRKREEFGGGGSTPLAAAAVSAAAAPPSTTAPAAAPASAALRLLAPLPDGVDEDVGSAVIGSGGTPLASAVLREPSPPALSASPTAAAAALLSSSSSSLPGSTLLPRLLSDMLVDVPVEVIASKLSRPVALDVATRGGAPGSLGAAVGAARGYRLPRAYLHSCHGLRVDGGPRQHDLAPMGLGAVLRLAASKHEAPRAADAGAAAAGLRPSKRSLKRALGTAVPLAQLARLHDKWCAYAWALVEAHARASGVATLLVSTSVAAPAGGGSFFAGGGGQSRASSKPGDAAGKGGVPGGFVLESLLKPTGKLKATAAAAAAAAGGDLRKTGGGANGSGTALTPAQVQRLLVTSAAVPGGLLRALDLHFAVLQGERGEPGWRGETVEGEAARDAVSVSNTRVAASLIPLVSCDPSPFCAQ